MKKKKKLKVKEKFDVKTLTRMAQHLTKLNKWEIKVRWANKQDFADFRRRKKLDPEYMGRAVGFYGVLVEWCPHSKTALIALNKKDLPTEDSIFETLIHEMLHIQIGCTAELFYMRKGNKETLGKFLSLNKEEKLIDLLINITSEFNKLGAMCNHAHT